MNAEEKRWKSTPKVTVVGDRIELSDGECSWCSLDVEQARRLIQAVNQGIIDMMVAQLSRPNA